MVRVIVVVLTYLIGVVGYAQQKSEKDTQSIEYHDVTININKTNSDKGTVLFALYNGAENFQKKNALQYAKSKVTEGKVQVIFKNLKPNTYAVVCFHDENENGKLDFEENGRPTEDFGATNNVLNYGPPQYEDAKFELKDKDLTFEIIL